MVISKWFGPAVKLRTDAPDIHRWQFEFRVERHGVMLMLVQRENGTSDHRVWGVQIGRARWDQRGVRWMAWANIGFRVAEGAAHKWAWYSRTVPGTELT